jgi:periplasmic divalent cation tolerance protein
MPDLERNRVSCVYTTVADAAQAEALARVLVQEKLVACVNITPVVTSVYEWQGQLTTETECSLMCKTPTERVPDVLARIAELHPYEIPAITAWQLDAVHPRYAQWVVAQTTGQPESHL